MQFKNILVLASVLACSGSAFGATLAYSDGGANGNNTGASSLLNIGREFNVTGTGITVVDLGIFAKDKTGNALSLSAAHTVTLFSIGTPNTANPSNTPLVSATVPAGTAGTYDSGFRFASITPTYLAPGNYAVIAYGLDNGNESYGDNGGPAATAGRLASANANDLIFDPYQFTPSGSPNFPNVGDGNNHNSASFHFDPGNTTPEPTSLTLLGASAAGLLIRRRRG